MLAVLGRACCFIAIVVLGFLLRKRGFFGPEAFKVISSIVLYITLPSAIISNSNGKPLDLSLLSLILMGLMCGVLYMALSWIANRNRPRNERAFWLINTPGYNIGTFALPFAQSFMGSTGVLTTSLFDVGNCVICLGGSYAVAASVKEGGPFQLKRVLLALAKSPPFLSHVLMMVLNLMGWRLPDLVVNFTGIAGNANAFLAMLMLGVGFKLNSGKDQIKDIVRVLVLRYSTAAVLAACSYFLLPFDLPIRQALVLLLVSPIGSSVPVYTAQLKEDVGLSSAVSSISMVVSIVLMVSLLMVMS